MAMDAKSTKLTRAEAKLNGSIKVLLIAPVADILERQRRTLYIWRDTRIAVATSWTKLDCNSNQVTKDVSPCTQDEVNIALETPMKNKSISTVNAGTRYDLG